MLNCIASDGIYNMCYYAISPEGYIDDQGKA